MPPRSRYTPLQTAVLDAIRARGPITTRALMAAGLDPVAAHNLVAEGSLEIGPLGYRLPEPPPPPPPKPKVDAKRSQIQRALEARTALLGGMPHGDPFPMAATTRLRAQVADMAPEASAETIKLVALRRHRGGELWAECFRGAARELETAGLSGRSRYLWRVAERVAAAPVAR